MRLYESSTTEGTAKSQMFDGLSPLALGMIGLTVVGISLGMIVRTIQRTQTNASQNCEEEDNESEVENLSTLLVE